MKAVVFHGVRDIRLDTVPDPTIKEPTDAIVRITSSAICGTDLHMIRGTMPGMKEGTIMGHEGIGIIEETGSNVRNLKRGDRVVIPSTIACGHCSYCRSGYTAQCDDANPNGPSAGTSFYGGPAQTGPFDGLQAQFARIPHANVNLVPLHPEIDDHQAICLSDIASTAWFGADIADISPGRGKTVLVMGCGPVGLFTILGAWHKGAQRVIAVDRRPDRLAKARELGAEVINFEEENPIEAIAELTGGIGPDRAIDVVGVDAFKPTKGPMKEAVEKRADIYRMQVKQLAEESAATDADHYAAGDAPSLSLEWAVQSLAKAGTLSIIGVYPQTHQFFPIGEAMNKNITMRMGNANHKKYVQELVELVRRGGLKPEHILTQDEPIRDVIKAYETFDAQDKGWIKVELEPAAA
ncbi:Threonine dehydrogenase [Fulvimarina manganoxydans]|uniref:Threonine dehydrogenase n=1 Tax=Fulvimarina manganoxydans TaxID=937218 RepID=A0A1W2AY36_9HYPH|nr:zinc-dependent alcohol dehydrogenase [Fulvimarina manganoxydans]MEE2950005.1 zinc-dependent alcohol dehydrogenase [Pseudomonadota bacterium]SMC65606.1 Threonine dehydrogenase [Fulvimarina manganoxydans]